ncbi:uncharacterized protein V6R79_021657 [Siganus canaliculatus]
MDEGFFKSALPAQESFVLDDSSLALPIPRPSEKVTSDDRNLRVQQQVQLTLSRKTRKTVSNGGVHLQKNMSKSFGASDGLGSNTKMNGFGFTTHSLSTIHVRKPSRRVEVSPPPSPQFRFRPLKYSTLRYGTHTHPGPRQSHNTGTLLDRSFGSDSFRQYSFSEVASPVQPRASSALFNSVISYRPSFRQAAPQHARFESSGFQQNNKFISRQSRSQNVIKQEKRTMQGQIGPTRNGEGLSWLAKMRRDAQEGHKIQSHPPSVASMEVDTKRQVEVAPPTQLIQTHNVTTVKSENKAPQMTLERAVNLLTHDDEETLVYAAGHIQHQCFRSNEAKKIVYYLHGIGKLLQLLRSDDEKVQSAAAGALRNVVYQSNENKMEVKESDGLATILDVLKSSRDKQIRRELTGLLWNLSSHDLIKERLSSKALPVLTKSVLVPSSGISEGENPKDELLADSAAFHNATGCLRNLSSAGPDGRKAMRECENLIDSLVYYVRGAIADYKTDDKTTENCVCIMHNLSYQIEAELPGTHARHLQESRQNLAPQTKAVGCFSPRSAKIAEHLERQCPLLEENANPHGIEWLWSTITIRMYLSLMARSTCQDTKEGAIGALQNLTAGSGAMSEAITFTIVRRENGLQHVKKMLQEGESDVKRTAVSLIRNLSRYQELHPDIVKHVLPELVAMLPDDDTGTDLPTEVTASLCHILSSVSLSDKQHVNAIVNEGALPKIIGISSIDSGYGPTRAGQAACVLLHTMYKHSDLHRAYRKCGFSKSDFINTRTTKAVNSG